MSCISPNNIHRPALQPIPVFSTVLHLILHFYLDANKPLIPSVLIYLTFLPPLPSLLSFVSLSPAVSTHTTLCFPALLPPEINPATGRVSQNKNCIVYLSLVLIHSRTQRNDRLSFPFLSPLQPPSRLNFLQRASCKYKRPTSLRFSWRTVASGSIAPSPPRPARTPSTPCCGTSGTQRGRKPMSSF